MNTSTWLIIFFVVEIVLERGLAERNSSYIILAPNIITPGQVLRVKVSILNRSEPVEVEAGIMDNKIVIASKNASFQSGATGELNIKIPSEISCKRFCTFFAKGSSSDGLRFNRQSRIQVRQKQMSIYVQTDKGIYKPGQTVHMRVFALFPDLTSYKGKMTVSILDPNNNKMVNWVDLQDPIGIIKKDFPISSQPVKGTWRIVVKIQEETGYRNFEVKHYVLPKFEVSITLPPYVLKKETRLIGHVTSKYTYGKGVHGTVILEVYFSRWRRRSIRRKFEMNGTASFIFDIEEIKDLFQNTYVWLQKSYLYQFRYMLTFNATIKDKLTGKSASSKKTVTFYQTDVTLNFPSFNPSNYKPGLPFIVVLKVTKPNGQMHHPEYLKTLTINTKTKYSWNDNVARGTHQPSPMGNIVISLDVPSYAKVVNIEALYSNGTRLLARAWFSASKFLSPGNYFIKLSTNTPSVKSGDKIHCQITSNFLMSTYKYLVIGRGGIRHFGSGTLQSSGHNTTFSLTTQPVMSPSARIVAYSVTNDSEVVVDSLTISVDNPFKNKVSLEFNTNTSRPGDEVKLVARATAGSQVAFLAVDKSVLLMKKDNDISRSQVLRELQSYSTGKGLYPWWDWGWFDCYVPFYISGVDAHSVFKNSGLIVFSDGLVFKRPIPTWQRRSDIFESAPESAAVVRAVPSRAASKKVRSFFPETWIWADLNASSTGKAELTIKVPDTITSWIASAFAISPSAGFGISSLKPKLQVFQPFFISLDLPYSVVRGEEVAIKVLIFNYLEEDQQVTVSFKASKDWSPAVANIITVRGNKEEAEDLKEILTVPAGQGKSIAFPIVPKTLGGIILTVHAQSSAAVDAVQRTLLVEPEGIPQEYSYSFLVDLNNTSSLAKDLQLSLPKTVVDGSSYVKVSLIGDMLGSSFNNLDKLLRMPYGCGEQNMINFAPNIFILKYLTAVNKVTSDIKEKAEKYMLTGYQRQQTYRHRDGSYSAFGEGDKEGSMWLTAFVVKSFAQARKFMYIDPNSLDLSLRWMVRKQNENGSFPRAGYVHSNYLKGGLKGELPLTAFVLIALSESKNSSKISHHRARILAVRYLEKNLDHMIISKDVYALAITAYALKLENSSSSDKALLALLHFAIRKDGTLHWSVQKQGLDKSTSFRPYYRPRSADIEVTSYALLTLSLYSNINNGVLALRWLSQQRNSLGGYASTQDTVLGIQAISELAALVYSSKMNFELTLTHSAIKSFSRTLSVHGGNSMVLQQVLIPKVEGILKVKASGYGIGLVQVGVTYHVTKAPLKSSFVFTVKNIREQHNHIETQVCAQWKGKGQSSSMSVIEMTVLSGFSADEERVNKLIEDKKLSLKRVDFQTKKVIFYFDQINRKNATCMSIKFDRTHDIGKSKPAPALVYDYYNPENRAETLYSSDQVRDVSICGVCPSCYGCQSSPTKPSVIQLTTYSTHLCSGCNNLTNTPVRARASMRNSTSPRSKAITNEITLLGVLALLLPTVAGN